MVALALTTEQRIPDHAERRIFGRRQLNVTVQARRLDHSLEARRHPRLTLLARDISLNGMSALSDDPVAIGEHLGIFFPPTAERPAWHAFAHVVRCELSAAGYRIAVEFDPLPAA